MNNENNIKKAYLISSVEEYGKLMAYCINNDICVFRTYWDDREKGSRCYSIDWKNKRCYYASLDFYTNYEENGCKIYLPEFTVNEFGVYTLHAKELE